MDKDSSTFGIPHDKLAHLWDLHSDREEGPEEYDQDLLKLELLNDMLARKMPLDRAVAQALSRVLAQLCKDIRPFTGDSFGHLLIDPETDFSIIKQIKEYYKGLSDHIQSEIEHDVIAVLYYAAIASALVYHRERITSFSNEHLRKAFLKCNAYAWLTLDLKSLFLKASEYCSKS
jgi:hypothetical protein